MLREIIECDLVSFKPCNRMDPIKLSLVLLLASVALAASGKEIIENECRKCTINGTQVFVKLITEPLYQAEYVCKASAVLVSKFGIIVDRICNPEECKNITDRPISRTFSRYDLFCDHVDSSLVSYHSEILKLIKDYLEILLMSSLFTLLVLKKSLLEKCLKKKSLGFFGFPKKLSTDVEIAASTDAKKQTDTDNEQF